MTESFAPESPFRFPASFWPAAAALWTAAVLALALSPSAQHSWLLQTLGDKILHGAAFTVGGVVWIRTLEVVSRLTRFGAWAAGTLAALLVGIAIEIGQSYVPSRQADSKDFVADAVGVSAALLVLALASLAGRRRSASRV